MAVVREERALVNAELARRIAAEREAEAARRARNKRRAEVARARAEEEAKRAEREAGRAAEEAGGDEARAARMRARLAQNQVFAKAVARNTGFCGECDVYCRRVAAHAFGYKLAQMLLDAAAVKPSTADDMLRHTKAARMQRHPLMQGRPPPDDVLARMQAEQQAAGRGRADRQRAQAAGLVGADAAEVRDSQLQAADAWRRVTRDIYEYPDDKFVELFDDESRRFFYYNVTTGKSQWYKPKTFEVYLDADAKAEEAAVAEHVLAQVGKVNAVGARASRANVAAIGMSAR